jgi:hypothetical protein
MKKIIVMVILGAATMSFVQQATESLVPGVGIEGYVTLGATTQNEVFVKYGNVYTEIKHTSEVKANGARPQVVSIEHQYKTQGVSFFYRPDKDTVTAIHVKPPFKAKTSKGIIMGESTLQEVENTYGKADIYEADDLMFTEYPGIRFYVKGKGLTEAQVMQQKVIKIAIIQIK